MLLTGATGFIGRALVLRLRRDGHEVSAWVRSPERARALLGGEIGLIDARRGPAELARVVAASGAIVNLAGEPILPRRWTHRRRRALVGSRVGLTDQIVQALAASPPRPRVLVSSSAVGFYGDRDESPLPESAGPGRGFLSELCAAWEAAAERAALGGVRVVTLRTGIVLGRDGGALASLLPLFRVGLGGRLGSGAQFVAWIHLHDHVELICRALADGRYSGPVNAVAPHPVTNRDLTLALSRALGRTPGPAVPAFVLRAVLGEGATALLSSQRAVPERAEMLGFHWAFPELPAALADLVGVPGVAIEPLPPGPLEEAKPASYLQRRPPHYLLRATAKLDAPLDEVFAFFSRPENLGSMTPAGMAFRILGDVGPMQAGASIDYRIRLGALPLRWQTTIERFSPSSLFIDSQARGPYSSWWHEHRFRAEGDHTVMEDRVYYALPFGWLGRIAHAAIVSRTLRAIFGFRAHAVRLRFGSVPELTADGPRGAT